MGLFDDKIVLITGAASGIGAATAHLFAGEGARVMATDKDATRLDKVVHALRTAGATIEGRQLDISHVGNVDEVIGSLATDQGRIDVAVNNAGILSAAKRLGEVEEEEFDLGIAVNLKGVWACMRAEVRAMLATGGGVIVNTASTSGLIGSAYSTTYTAAKHGVIGLTKAAALDYADRNIRINAVCPGAVATPMTEPLIADEKRRQAVMSRFPMGRLGTPEEIASAILWLASPGADYVTGSALVVDGGLTAQ